MCTSWEEKRKIKIIFLFCLVFSLFLNKNRVKYTEQSPNQATKPACLPGPACHRQAQADHLSTSGRPGRPVRSYRQARQAASTEQAGRQAA